MQPKATWVDHHRHFFSTQLTYEVNGVYKHAHPAPAQELTDTKASHSATGSTTLPPQQKVSKQVEQQVRTRVVHEVSTFR
jgi:hypothetical protein